MQRYSSLLVIPALAALAVGTGGVVAPKVAHAQFCVEEWPETTIITIGKGQSPSNNPKVSSAITGHIIDPGSLGETAHRIEACTGTSVSVVVMDTSGEVGLSQDDTRGPIVCDDTTNTCQVASLTATAKYIARSFDGKDTDRMTLLPGGEPPIGEIGSHQCVLGAGSGLLISNFLVPIPLSLAGSAEVTCGVADEITGKAECGCAIQQIAPIPIGGIGIVCVNPGMQTCETGEIDCDGGNLLDIEVESDHNIGGCTDQATCESACGSYCSGLGLSFVSSGCEGFCTFGAQMPCTSDAECAAAEQGSCSGGDPPAHAGACGCHCSGIDGSPSRAGGLLCSVPTSIKVVAPGSCDPGGLCCDAPPSIDVGEACIAVTTETVTNLLKKANNTTNELPCFNPDPASCSPGTGGSTETGSPADCEFLVDSVTSGTSLLGAVNFFDSALGDLAVGVNFTCQ